MTYDELEAAIRRLVAAAGPDDLRAFGADTITRFLRDDLLFGFDAEEELDEGAWAALTTARETALTAGPAELRTLLTRIDEGVRTDGDMDPGLLAVLAALELWTAYLEEGRRDDLYELALRSVEQVDFRVSPELGDFLAHPEMAAEYQRIRRLLTP